MSCDHVFLGLGTNLGNREENLKKALDQIGDLPKTRLFECSSIYETEPVGVQDQPDFLNMVIRVSTDLSPHAFHRKLKEIEVRMGRVRNKKWGPRVIDIDLLFWGNKTVDSPTLTIPHPSAQDRRFVLEPLLEIAPDFQAPPDNTAIKSLLEKRDGNKRVRRYSQIDSSIGR